MVVRQLKNLLAFLTVFPVSMDENFLEDCAKNMWAFPLIGALLGIIAGAFGWVALHVLPAIVVGVLVLGLLLLLTGLHHADGLLDFGDGVMVHGTPERKIEVMHDKFTGAGGLCLGIMTFLVSALAFGQLRLGFIVGAVVVVEVSAKLAMVVMAWAGKSVHEGMNSSFLSFMHGNGGSWRLIAALVISFAIAVPLLWWTGVLVVLAGIITSLVMTAIAHKHFRGVTGDVFGATNELTRMVCIVVLLAVILWA
ncbi:MAG: adenosylcobinamide-GDP ribazoletransferase [Candidatus Bathyarchaeota archaeon]|nr:adenosylcobinamide-GDP ribazoletransferase [Candidatus Bathyarchaeota archaeon]